jgi:hypothetical protein
MKKPAKTDKPLNQTCKSSPKKTAKKKATTDTHPRCSRCGSRTVHLEQLEQELLVTISLHCLICGHYTFLGRPVIRLLRRPNVTIPDSITRPAGE